MSLRTKLVLAFLVVAAVVVAQGIVNIASTMAVRDRFTRIVEETAPSLLLLGQYKAAAFRAMLEANTFEPGNTEEKEEFQEAAETVTGLGERIRSLATDRELADAIRMLRTDAERMVTAGRELIERKERAAEKPEPVGRTGEPGRAAPETGGEIETEETEEVIEKLEGAFVASVEKVIRVENARLSRGRSGAEQEAGQATLLNIASMAVGVLVAVGLGVLLARIIVSPVNRVRQAALEVARGNLDHPLHVRGSDEVGELARAMRSMIQSLRDLTYFSAGRNDLNERMQGDHDPAALADRVVGFLAPYVGSGVGALYVMDDATGRLRLLGTYAYRRRKSLAGEFAPGEGLVGQAALERKTISISRIPEDYVRISSGLGDIVPREIVVVPLVVDERLVGVVELGAAASFSSQQISFLEEVAGSIAIVIDSAQARIRLRHLLEETQRQAHELKQQREDLRLANEGLERQTQALRESEKALQNQQEELRVTNLELEERTKSLEEQRDAVRRKNDELTRTRLEIEAKARELQQANRYKSDFLANMSHELRTPLNSILILSDLLTENKNGALEAKQIEFARTIHTSGQDLLSLINDILDLSKVEAGKVDLEPCEVSLRSVVDDVERTFAELAGSKRLAFDVRVAAGLPSVLVTDPKRFQQILKNLLSNAFKFTESGRVVLDVSRPASAVSFRRTDLDASTALAFAVEDTGPGIAAEAQEQIFEAFHQEDGSTRRKHEGTGLGLSISRELAALLGGEIHVESEPGRGSRFTLFVPERLAEPTAREDRAGNHPAEGPVSPSAAEAGTEVPKVNRGAARVATSPADDRDALEPHDRTLLIVEDDAAFAGVLCDLAREQEFKCVVAPTGGEGLDLARRIGPSAVILDVGLPDMSGFKVMERLKSDPETRHIPVHFMSASDAEMDALKMGAVGFLRKPISREQIVDALRTLEARLDRPVKRLLLVEDDADHARNIEDLVGGEDVETVTVSSPDEAFRRLEGEAFDCMILDVAAHSGSGLSVLDAMQERGLSSVPVIAYAEEALDPRQECALRRHAQSSIVKGARSPARLLDETALFLHRIEANLPSEKRRMIRSLHDDEVVLQGKKVLVVDDDMRNVFSLVSVLEGKGIEAVVGRNGREGLEKLEEHSDVAAVLMDIMMPEMDGYEAMARIRQDERFRGLPVIALTAKAMKGDRARCIEAGADDYLAKPLDAEKLLSMLRVWIQA